MFRFHRLARLVVSVLGLCVILMQFTPTQGLKTLCQSLTEIFGSCPPWLTWDRLHLILEGIGFVMVIAGVIWFFLPEHHRAKLKISGPFFLPNHTGHDRWRIRVKNKGPFTTDNVRMRLIDVRPRPRYARWQADFPYEVERVGKKLTDAPARLNKDDTEDFELKTWIGHDGNLYASLDTKDIPPLYRVVIEPDEVWRLTYEITAENAKRKSFSATMRVQDGKIIVERA